MNKWFSVEEDFPDYGENVLVFCDNGRYSIGYTYTFPECAGDLIYWEIENSEAGDVVYWTDLPKAPNIKEIK